MSYAPDYTPGTSFADDETNNVAGRSLVKTDSLDAELADISSSINALNTNQKALQRDDNKLKDGLVEPYALAEQTKSLIAVGGCTPRGTWTPNTDYAYKDVVQRSNVAQICLQAHNSGSAFTQAFWLPISGDGTSAANAAAAAASAAAAAASQTNASASESAAASSASSAATSATAASTAATNASNSAASASSSEAAALAAANSINAPLNASTDATGSSTSTTSTVSPSWLKSGFAISLTTNGYIKAPNWFGGWILEWGTATATSTGTIVNLPLTVPNTILGVGSFGVGNVMPSQYSSSAVLSLSQIVNWASSGSMTVFWILLAR